MMLPSVNLIAGERRGYVDGPSGQVHYREMGSGPVVMLVHQAPWTSIQYHKAMPLLAVAGFRVIAPDLPGHGMSDPPHGEPLIEDYARAMFAVAQGLGLNGFAVAGHHGGALVAARMAAEYSDQVTALITDNVPLYTTEQRTERLENLVDAQDIKADGSHLSDRWAVTRKVADPEWSDETIHIGTIAYFANGPWKEQGHRAAPIYDFAADIDRIKCPVLIISSRKDRLFPVGQQLVARRPDWNYAELPGASGMVFERTAEWAAPIINFLKELKLPGNEQGSGNGEDRMTITIYGRPGSRARRPLWVARELGLDVNNIEPAPGEIKEAAYLAINPNGKVPALIDGDLTLFESLAQSMYLAKKYGTGTLYPEAVEDEARLWQWTLWVVNEVEKGLVTCLMERVIKAEDVRNVELADATEIELRKPLFVLDEALADREWLLGKFSVTDINVSAVLALAKPARISLESFPNVLSWLERATSRPAYEG